MAGKRRETREQCRARMAAAEAESVRLRLRVSRLEILLAEAREYLAGLTVADRIDDALDIPGATDAPDIGSVFKAVYRKQLEDVFGPLGSDDGGADGR